MLSELNGSISPAADNAQHYITRIKYSEAQYNQVNLCTYSTLSQRKRHILMLKMILSKIDLHYEVNYNNCSRQTNCLSFKNMYHLLALVSC